MTNKEVNRLIGAELALYALHQWAPGEAAKDAWALLTGYDFRPPHLRRRPLPAALRWLLSAFKAKHDWRMALAEYAKAPADLRMFDIGDIAKAPVPRQLAAGATRGDAYARALADLPPHKPGDHHLAEPDTDYALPRGRHAVRFPGELLPPPPAQHRLTRKRHKLTLRWATLLATARDMDAADSLRGESRQWEDRINDIRLLLDKSGRLKPGRALPLRGLVHVVGMPAVGKTTLITVAAVWAARCRPSHRLTIVLGDVMAVLTMVEDLARYSVDAAPILGAANRGRHLQQLHRPADPTVRGFGLLDDDRTRWLSTGCTTQGLLDLPAPLPLRDIPCERKLRVWNDDAGDEEEPSRKTVACPMFGSCGWHEASRALVTAPIWVTTSQGLLHSRVPSQVSEVSLRDLDLAWMRSDAFLIDEADRVQIQWDQAFSPSQTLAGPSREAWLSEIRPLFEQHMRNTHGRHFTSAAVRDWQIHLDSAGQLVARLWGLMGAHPYVREWLNGGYFNEWLLGVKLASRIAERPARPPSTTPGQTPATRSSPGPAARTVTDEVVYKEWLGTFSEWITKPADRYLGTDPRVGFLRDISARGYATQDVITGEITDWLETLPDVRVGGEEALQRLAVQFHVTIVVALLAQKLNLLTRACWEVETQTGMESMSSHLVHRPPVEYQAVVPDSPMGNLLGFQYREREDSAPDNLGTLSFFRCSGVGRWLLLNLPGLYGPADTGPATLLLSATSWAGTSPRYHVQAPVAAVLRSSKGDRVPLDERIVLDYLPTSVAGEHNQSRHVRVSGTFGDRRAQALAMILKELARARDGLRGPQPSTLETIRDTLPANRQRLLLLVGSYREAEDVLRELVTLRPEWDEQILQMVPDDDSGTHFWTSGTIARNNIHSLAQHQKVWILIAPQLAIERGHNILNDAHVAALGATLYLVRPHLHPEDMSYHVERMHHRAVDEIQHQLPTAGPATASLGERADLFLRLARRAWMDELYDTLRYSLTTQDSVERRAMDWTNIAPLNQIIGRMLRGGATARVYFCDGAFAPREKDSPLLGMYRALDDAFNGPDAAVAQALYEPLHHALHTLLEKYRGDL
ncbi:hypothetical protein [Amycolatopsis sp. YIM 10]|uniref:pPIWI_RE_Z domain-containing protein n=1 Tax=Amycolatopsis sp. YIM 10 TaxID=2653857 RepID=UPI00128FF1BB|nr:hypothetical protein [Amycolatopsis sp. YIM 10]QFU86654.1 hypothetical protein YIM_07215 [Amycolatopsis sp. YIM 10]